MTMSTYRKITQIEIENYRAFYGKEVIRLEKGENLLIYGENGSGKSSLYHALKDYFEVQDPHTNTNLAGNWFTSDAPSLQFTFSTFDQNGLIDGSAKAFEYKAAPAYEEDQEEFFIYKANLAKGFFSYRELLATHLGDPGYGEVDLFDLFTNKVLRDFRIANTDETLLEFWMALDMFGVNLHGHVTENPEPDERTEEWLEGIETKTRGDLEDFQDQLESILITLESKANELNRYFNHGISLSFTLERTEINPEEPSLESPRIFLKVKYNGLEIPDHHLYLNEARLSALAISLFLASVLDNPTVDVYKILFLDDIFLGLDTGNRLPLLKILNDYFKDYQTFITTYDREWFEVAGMYLSGNWKKVELYVQEEILFELIDGTRVSGILEPPTGSKEIKFERPLIIDPSLDYYDKAKIYFSKKDYPACANYQRKWCEQFLKNYLQENYRLEIGVNDSVLAITKLDTLFQKLRLFYRDCGLTLPSAIETIFPSHRDTVMNPFSHDNLTSPIYRRELEQGFELIEAFKQLKRLRKGVVAYKDDILEYHEPSVNYSCRFKIVSQPLILVNHGGDLKILGKGDVIDFTAYGKTQNAPPQGMKDLTVDQFYEKIKHHLSVKYPGFTPNVDKFSALVLQPQRITLRDVIIG